MTEVAQLADKAEELAETHARSSRIAALLEDSSDAARLILRVVSESPLVRQRLDEYQSRLKHVRPILTGKYLRQLGIPPGPVYHQILDRLLAGRLDGEISDRAQEEEVVRRMLADWETS